MSIPAFMSPEHIAAMRELLLGEPTVLAVCRDLDRGYTVSYALADGPGGEDVHWQMTFDPATGVHVGLGEPEHADVVFHGDWTAVMRATAARRRGEAPPDPFAVEGDSAVLDHIGPAFAAAQRVATIETSLPDAGPRPERDAGTDPQRHEDTVTDSTGHRVASTSPRLDRFDADLARDPEAAVQALLADLAAAGGPIVETAEDGSDALVTFAYVDDADQIELNTPALMLNAPRLSEPMRRAAGTNVWTLAVRIARDVTTAYRFQVEPPTLGDTAEEMMTVLSDPERYAAFTAAYARSVRPDPYNPRQVVDLANGSEEPQSSVLTMPDAVALPRTTDISAQIEEHRLPGGRRIDLYRPAGGGDDLPLVVVLDGEHCRRGLVVEHLDTAIAEGRVPPVRAVLWHNLSPTSRMVEMACNPVLPAALADELFPWLEAHGQLPPASLRVLAGFNYGGLATAYTVMHRPDLFGAALPISASLFFTPDPGTEPGEWLTRQTRTDNTRARWFLAVGRLEDIPIDLPGVESGTTMVSSARRFHEALRNAGADVVGLLEHPSGHEMFTVHAAVEQGLAALLPHRPTDPVG